MAARIREGLVGRLLIGRRLGFPGTGADGEDAVQGRVEAIRRPALQGAAPMAGVGAVALPPPRLALGKSRGRGKGDARKGADRRGPPVSGSGGVVGGKQAGWLCVLGRKAWWVAA
jgi:hypothetical protein